MDVLEMMEHLRAIDIEIAKLFGYMPLKTENGVCILLDEDDCPYYSSDIRAAWSVVELVIEKGLDFDLWNHEGGWRGVVIDRRGSRFETIEDGTTAPLAICKVALQAAKDYLWEGAVTTDEQ